MRSALLEGVALIGHLILLETNSDAAMKAFVKLRLSEEREKVAFTGQLCDRDSAANVVVTAAIPIVAVFTDPLSSLS